MTFLDEINLQVSAGKGGDGVVRWRREKFIAKGGPNGGDGGRGGDVYIRAIRSLRVLDQYRSKKEFAAQDGTPGDAKSLKGADGDRLYIDFPIGSTITVVGTGVTYDLLKEGQEFKLLRGGQGGFGNEHFKSSTNQAPANYTPGKAGESVELHIEVSLIADAGLVGFPNAGKSSLLNALTNASAKVGDYPFTTLDPNLGDLYGFIIADIPGLIEGASEGRGLGHTFLRHVSRTKVLVHLVSFEHSGPSGDEAGPSNDETGMMKQYLAIREELAKFGQGLAEKDEIILLTKTDTTDQKTIDATVKEFKKLKKPVFTSTLFDEASVKTFNDELIKLLKKDISFE